jgi:RNA polymerase sigma-70 factor (ECF subfamily)
VDSADFDDCYRATAHRLVQYAYAMCGDLPTAQDLAQEAYIRAWQRWRRLSRYEHPESWLRLVVTRLCTDRWRRLGVRHRAQPLLRPLEHTPAPSEDSVLLTTALRRVPPAQRRVLVLHYLMDLSITDVATETGVTVGTVKSQLARGRATLAAALGEQPLPAGTEANDAR